MPITQERMMLLISAAKDYQQAFQKTIRLIKQESENIKQGRSDYRQSFENLETMVSQFMLVNPEVSGGVILAEDRHFKASAGRNRSNRNWQRGKRQEEGGERKQFDSMGRKIIRGRSTVDPATLRELRIYETRTEQQLPSTAPTSLQRKERDIGSAAALVDRAVGIEPSFPLDPTIAEDEEGHIQLDSGALSSEEKSSLDKEVDEEIERQALEEELKRYKPQN